MDNTLDLPVSDLNGLTPTHNIENLCCAVSYSECQMLQIVDWIGITTSRNVNGILTLFSKAHKHDLGVQT